MDLINSFNNYLNISLNDLPDTNWEKAEVTETHPQRTAESDKIYEKFISTNLYKYMKFKPKKSKFRTYGELPKEMKDKINDFYGLNIDRGENFPNHKFNLEKHGLSYIYFDESIFFVSKNYCSVLWKGDRYDGKITRSDFCGEIPFIISTLDYDDCLSFDVYGFAINKNSGEVFITGRYFNVERKNNISVIGDYSFCNIKNLAIENNIVIFSKSKYETANLSKFDITSNREIYNLGLDKTVVKTKGTFKKGGIYHFSGDFEQKTKEYINEIRLFENINDIRFVYTVEEIYTTFLLFFPVIVKSIQGNEIRKIVESEIDHILNIETKNNTTYGFTLSDVNKKPHRPTNQRNIKIKGNFLTLPQKSEEEADKMIDYAEIFSFLTVHAFVMEKYNAVILGSANTFMLNTNTKAPNDIDIWVNSGHGSFVIKMRDDMGWEITSSFCTKSSKISPNIHYVVNMSNKKYKFPIQIIHVNVDPRDMADQFDLSVAKAIWDPKTFFENQKLRRLNYKGTEASVINDILNMECEFLERPWDLDRCTKSKKIVLTERSKRRILKYMEKGFKIKIHKDSIFTINDIRNFLLEVPDEEFSVNQNFAGFYVIDSIDGNSNPLSEKLRKVYNIAKNLNNDVLGNNITARRIYSFVCKILFEDPLYSDVIYIKRFTDNTKSNRSLVKNNYNLCVEIDP